MKRTAAVLASLAASARAGTVLWSGIFNSTTTVADFDKWSWSNQIQPWQWYIHGSGQTSEYLGLSSSFKNPADTSSGQGVRTTIDGTAFWNGQTMERTEIIPQTTANLGTGHLYYHFSLMTKSTNAPNPGFEHQIAFFESHFTELKFGLISGEAGATDPLLRWDIGGQSQWTTTLTANNWYNFAYDIDFGAGTVGLWASNGSAPLTQIKANVKASPSTNSADWHVGVLRLPNGGTNAAAEDWFWSGVYVEQAPITTSIAGPLAGSNPTGSAPPATSSAPPATSSAPPATSSAPPATSSAPPATSSKPPATTSTVSTCSAAKYAQCGGQGFTGCTTCASGSTCQVSNPYYSQCL